MGAGLRSRSWQANAARMQLAQNMERDGMDFERNRRFTLRCAELRMLDAACLPASDVAQPVPHQPGRFLLLPNIRL